MKAALAGVLFAWLCLLQSAYGVANLGPVIRDPANFLAPHILVGAEMTTTIKPSRPQTPDRQATASGIPDFLSRDPLGEKEDLNLYQLTGGDPINYVDRDGLAKVALDGKSNLTAIGQIILDIAKGDPNAARSLLMAKQVDAETAGIAVAGDGGEDSIRNVTRAIETAVGNAHEDGRDEWRMIAAKAGLRGERHFDGNKSAWMTAKLAEYAPMIAANAGAALELRAAERAMNDKATAYQNSAAYKLREFADAPFDVAAFGISAGAATDVTTGNAVTWNSWNNGGGLGLAEVTPGERAFATAMVFLPVGRVGGVADNLVSAGARGKSFTGTALKPWVSGSETTSTALAKYWPGNSGFVGSIERTHLMPGTQIDRYGFPGGNFTSPIGTRFESRALPAAYLTEKPYHMYEVLKPIEINSGRIMPWFGHIGMGVQHELPVSVEILLKRGFLREVGP